jgi:hypothetical protein
LFCVKLSCVWASIIKIRYVVIVNYCTYSSNNNMLMFTYKLLEENNMLMFTYNLLEKNNFLGFTLELDMHK